MRDQYRDTRIRRFATYLSAIICLIAFGAWEVPAAPSDLDPTFGNGGIVITSGNNLWAANAMAIQSDGKVVVVGSSGTDPNILDFAVVRYNTNGSLDSSFGGAGIVITPLGYTYESANSVAIQVDGKIVVAGSAGNNVADFAVVRYNPNGSLDTTFNGTGIVITPVGTSTDLGNSVAIQTDGKIVVAGSSVNSLGNQDFAVVRYNTNGSLDTTFNGTGKVVTPVGLFNFARSVAIQTDGRIVVAGHVSDGTAFFFGIVRYNADGSLDTTFNGTGKVMTSVGNANSSAYDLAIQPDGKIVAVGYGNDEQTQTRGVAFVRYNPNGSLDTSFGGTGKIIVGGPVDSVGSVAIQSDGKIVAAGYCQHTVTGDDFAVFRVNPNGTLDTSFNGTGKVTTSISAGTDWAYAVAIQTDGRIVVAGTSFSGPAFVLVRYQARPGGPFDYDGDGKTDFSVYRSSNGTWYVARSLTSDMYVRTFWTYGILPADYDGDGKTDLAACDYSHAFGNSVALIIFNSSTNATSSQPCLSGELALAADFDGDGKADHAAVTELWSWQIALSQSGSIYRQGWGGTGDKPVPADFDGDGRAELAVWRPSEGRWYVANLWTGAISTVNWGVDGDIPVVGDYSGDGRADFAVYRPSNNTWYRLHSSDYSMHVQTWGAPNDVVTPGDYDGDGRMDLAVFRPSEGKWYVMTPAQTIITASFGEDGDIPTPSAFIY